MAKLCMAQALERATAGKDISSFSEGDVITRIKRCVMKHTATTITDIFGRVFEVPPRSDGSYIGEPLKLIALKNGCIVLQHIDGYFKGDLLSLDIENWNDEGWLLYEK